MSIYMQYTSIHLINDSSVADSTRLKAIMLWGDVLRDQHELYIWLLFSQQTRMFNHANDLLQIIEVLRSSNASLSKFHDEVLTKTALLIDCHSVGLAFLSHSRGRLHMEGEVFQVEWTDAPDFPDEEIERWGTLFQYLLESLLYVVTLINHALFS